MNVVLLTNILTPYRAFFFDKLYNYFKNNNINFTVLVMAETEPDRNWNYSDLKTEYTILLENKSLNLFNMNIHINSNIISKLSEMKPNIVIAAGGYNLPSVYMATMMKKKIGYKILFWSESHLNEIKHHNRLVIALREYIRKKIYIKFDGFWYSGEMSKIFITKYAREKKLIFVPNLIDSDLYKQGLTIHNSQKVKLKDMYNLEKDKFIFICPARLNKVKGIDKFIKLIAKSSNKNNITILIPGEGELKEYLQEISSEYKLDVRFLGFKCQDEMVKLYSISDCFLMPSLSDPNPLTCVEALHSGLPLIVSSHVGNNPEVIEYGKNGFVFDYSKEKEAIEAIDFIVKSDYNWREEARSCSLRIAEDIYNVDKVVANLIKETTEI